MRCWPDINQLKAYPISITANKLWRLSSSHSNSHQLDKRPEAVKASKLTLLRLLIGDLRRTAQLRIHRQEAALQQHDVWHVHLAAHAKLSERPYCIGLQTAREPNAVNVKVKAKAAAP